MEQKEQYNQQFSILTVDDVPKNLQVLGTILRKENYQVSFASSGKAALSIIESDKPDLILLDIMMPEMDGYDVCQKLKSQEDTREIPIIFLTAKNETEDIVKGFEYGAVDYVTKPFNVSELLARVSTHLELKKSKETLKKLNAMNSKFFGIMSKDIRNALIGVKGVAQFMLDDIKADNKENIVKMAMLMYNDSTKLFDLLENLIEWSNINTNSIDNKPHKYNLKEIINNIYTQLEDRIKIKNIDFITICEDNVYTKMDLHMLNTILYDVVNNAIKFSRLEGGKITVEISDYDDDFWQIAIADNGIGMKNDVVNNLFKIETKQYKTIGTANEVGSGLGLIICKALIEKNEGKIWATSKYKRGTTVFITLPKYK